MKPCEADRVGPARVPECVGLRGTKRGDFHRLDLNGHESPTGEVTVNNKAS